MEILKELKQSILERLDDRLKDLENNKEINQGEYDFNSNDLHDIIFEELDSFACNWDRTECLEVIDYCKNEEYIDKGIVNTTSIDRILSTTAFECARQWLFDNCELLNDLQDYDLSEEKRKNFIKRINEEINL